MQLSQTNYMKNVALLELLHLFQTMLNIQLINMLL